MRFFNNIIGIGITLGAIALFVLILGMWRAVSELPDYAHLADYTPPVMSRAHAGDGALIAEFAQERRLFVPIDVVPAQLIQALLAAEDKNFYAHIGIDIAGIIRATGQNIINVLTGRRLEGASTITQQVAKNFLLSSDVTLERKLKEAILALRLERTFSKRQILELYVNEIYLGFGSYGIAAASLNYFGKPLRDLSLSEAAYLAALPKAPNNYHPFRHPARALARRNWVLARMAENNFITQEEAQAASATPLNAITRRVGIQDVAAGYFVENVRRRLYDIYGEKQLYGGGLSVRTTLDTHLQTLAMRALRDGLERYDRRQGYRGAVATLPTLSDWQTQLAAMPMPRDIAPRRLAVVLAVDAQAARIGLRPHTKEDLQEAQEEGRITAKDAAWAGKIDKVLAVGDVVWTHPKKNNQHALKQMPEVNGAVVALDPHTGRVLAMIGGYSFSLSEFNRAMQAERQPGSAFKPFVYAAALDNGFTPASLVLDAPFVMEQGNDQALWKPENYSRTFFGLSTLRLGVEKSRNLMTVRLAQEIGMDNVARYAKRFNITPNMPKVLAMALGAGETELLTLTTAYAMLVNGGKKIAPVFIDRIQDRYGKTLYRQDTRPCIGCVVDAWQGQTPPDLPDNRAQILSPQTAYQMVSLLEGVVKRGTGRSIASLGKSLAGKTGTTNDNRDAWFIGFSPDLAVGVYVGYDDHRSLGERETGGRVAAPIFKQFMRGALKGVPTPPFRIPPGVSLVRINARTGKVAQTGDSRVILESFKRGSEPTRTNEQRIIGESHTTPRGNVGGGNLGAGTGGLY